MERDGSPLQQRPPHVLGRDSHAYMYMRLQSCIGYRRQVRSRSRGRRDQEGSEVRAAIKAGPFTTSRNRDTRGVWPVGASAFRQMDEIAVCITSRTGDEVARSRLYRRIVVAV